MCVCMCVCVCVCMCVCVCICVYVCVCVYVLQGACVTALENIAFDIDCIVVCYRISE